MCSDPASGNLVTMHCQMKRMPKKIPTFVTWILKPCDAAIASMTMMPDRIRTPCKSMIPRPPVPNAEFTFEKHLVSFIKFDRFILRKTIVAASSGNVRPCSLRNRNLYTFSDRNTIGARDLLHPCCRMPIPKPVLINPSACIIPTMRRPFPSRPSANR